MANGLNMGMFDMLDLVREGGWKTGVEMKQKKKEQMQFEGGMRLHNQIFQSLVEKKTKKTNTINPKMIIKNINVDILKHHNDISKIKQDDITQYQVNNKEIIKIEEALLPQENNEKDVIKDKAPKVEPKPTPKIEEPTISSKTLLEVVQNKQGTWDRDLYILNPDPDITSTIKKTFEAHGCSVQVSGLERDLEYLYVLLDRKVSIKRLKKLMEKGKKFGLEFFLTKTGLTSSLLARNLGKRFS